MNTKKGGVIRDTYRHSGRVPGRGVGRALAACGCAAGLLAGIAATAYAEGDAAAGRRLYQNKCLSCHGDAKTKGTLGPSLVGIMGRKASETGQGAISRAMSEAEFTWDDKTLNEFLAAPSEKVHGTIMPIGVKRPQDRDDLIAYIKSMH
jgi:cytochrome c